MPPHPAHLGVKTVSTLKIVPALRCEHPPQRCVIFRSLAWRQQRYGARLLAVFVERTRFPTEVQKLMIHNTMLGFLVTPWGHPHPAWRRPNLALPRLSRFPGPQTGFPGCFGFVSVCP